MSDNEKKTNKTISLAIDGFDLDQLLEATTKKEKKNLKTNNFRSKTNSPILDNGKQKDSHYSDVGIQDNKKALSAEEKDRRLRIVQSLDVNKNQTDDPILLSSVSEVSYATKYSEDIAKNETVGDDIKSESSIDSADSSLAMNFTPVVKEDSLSDSNVKLKKKGKFLKSEQTEEVAKNVVEGKSKKNSFSQEGKLKNRLLGYLELPDDVEGDEVLEEEIVKTSNISTTSSSFVRYNRPKKRKSKYKREKLIKHINLISEISVLDLAKMLAEKEKVVLHELKNLSLEVKSDFLLDIDTASIVASNLGHVVEVMKNDTLERKYLDSSLHKSNLSVRAPVVSVMGHVDHGKTTLLDAIRQSSLASLEKGGITQSLGAYEVFSDEGKIVFLDTPGHEAFANIRSSGSKVADIVLLVVAADDGVKPQTVEAITHSVEAKLPIIVVINKIDKLDADIVKLKTDLMQHSIVIEEFGGESLCVEVSALNNKGIDNLLSTILLQADILNLLSNPEALGIGRVIEVSKAKGMGYVATVIVLQGSMSLGDHFVTNTSIGHIKSIQNFLQQKISIAGPSTPVEISGFSDLVSVGDVMIVVESEINAVKLLNEKLARKPNESLVENDINATLLSLLNNDTFSNNFIWLNVIIKSDVQGSLDAIEESLLKIKHANIGVKVLHKAIGDISESDVNLALISDKVFIIGFNVKMTNRAKEIHAANSNVMFTNYNIIYKIIEDVKVIMSDLLGPDLIKNIIGRAKVKEVFTMNKIGIIAGSVMLDGVAKNPCKFNVTRDNVVMYEGDVKQLKRFKEDVKEVRVGLDFGLLSEWSDFLAEDIVEFYTVKEVKKHIE